MTMNYGAAIARTVANFKNKYKAVHGRGGHEMKYAATLISRELEWAFWQWDESRQRGTKHDVWGVTVYLPGLDKYTRNNVLAYISDVIYESIRR